MKRATLVILTFIALSGISQATNWYVRPTAQGSGNGTNWNNAWTPSTILWANVKPGDTVWLAGGTYTDKINFTKSGTAASPINFWRATSADSAPTSAAGWQASLDATAIFNSPATMWHFGGPLSYVNVDGRTSAGIVLNEPNQGGDMLRFSDTGNTSNINVSNLRLVGSSNKTTLTSGRYGVSLLAANYGRSQSFLTFTGIDIGPINVAFRMLYGQNIIIQRCTIHDVDADNMDHQDTIYGNGSGGELSNITFRYNTIYNGTGNGVFFETDSNVKNFYIYGNLFYNAYGALFSNKPPSSFPKNQTFFLYNNLFGGYSTDYSWVAMFSGSQNGSFMQNNLFWDGYNAATNMNPNGLTYDYNAYNIGGQVAAARPAGEQHGFQLTGDPFINSRGNPPDFHLTSQGIAANPALANGQPLSPVAGQTLSTDRDGNTFGTGGHWYVGPYQFSANPTPTPAPSPTPSPTATPTPAPTPSPTPVPTPTYEQWIKKQNDWIRANPPMPD